MFEIINGKFTWWIWPGEVEIYFMGTHGMNMDKKKIYFTNGIPTALSHVDENIGPE